MARLLFFTPVKKILVKKISGTKYYSRYRIYIKGVPLTSVIFGWCAPPGAEGRLFVSAAGPKIITRG